MAYNPEKPYKNQILRLIKETWHTPYISVKDGTYSLFKRKFNYLEVDHTDGIGTKGVHHWRSRNFKDAVIEKRSNYNIDRCKLWSFNLR